MTPMMTSMMTSMMIGPRRSFGSLLRAFTTAALIATLVVALTGDSAWAQARQEIPDEKGQQTTTPSAIQLLFDVGQLLKQGKEKERQTATSETQRLLVQRKISTKTLDRPRLPMLMPAYYIEKGRLEVFSKRNFYAFNQYLDNAHIETIGTRLKPPVKSRMVKVRPHKSASGEKYLIQRTDFSVDLSFSRYGSVYNISIICDRPATDDKCRKDDFIKSLYNKLLMAGGKT